MNNNINNIPKCVLVGLPAKPVSKGSIGQPFMCVQLSPGTLLSKQCGHGCNSHSISCVQIGGSNNSIAAANSLTAEAWVQKSRIMQWRPVGNSCPKAISFNIGQALVGITQWLNNSGRQRLLFYMSVWNMKLFRDKEQVDPWRGLCISQRYSQLTLTWVLHKPPGWWFSTS